MTLPPILTPASLVHVDLWRRNRRSRFLLYMCCSSDPRLISSVSLRHHSYVLPTSVQVHVQFCLTPAVNTALPVWSSDVGATNRLVKVGGCGGCRQCFLPVNGCTKLSSPKLASEGRVLYRRRASLTEKPPTEFSFSIALCSVYVERFSLAAATSQAFTGNHPPTGFHHRVKAIYFHATKPAARRPSSISGRSLSDKRRKYM